MEKHVIIISRGLSGLTNGYILVKNEFCVTIFKKNIQFGGYLQTFGRHVMKFEIGMHYIGSKKKEQLLYTFLKHLNLLTDVKISPLNAVVEDLISTGSKRYLFANGTENSKRKQYCRTN